MATIKVTKVNSNETAIAMIGTSLALLQKHSALMSSKQGKKVELMCKKSLEKDFNPIDDMRATKEYRIEVAKNLLMKCFLEIKNKKILRLN